MRYYMQMAQHLASFIITHPMDMYTQVNVFVNGMRKGQNRLSVERAEPATLEEASTFAFPEDVRATKAFTKPSVVTFVQPFGLESMEIDVIESSLSAARQSQRRRMLWKSITRALPRLHVRNPAGTSRCRAPYCFERRSGSTGGSPTSKPPCAKFTVKCQYFEW